MKMLVIGLGNPLVSDDSVGLRIAEVIEELACYHEDVDVMRDYWGGLRLMEQMIGYDRAIVIDAIQSGAPAGTIHRLQVESMPTQKSASAHDMNLATALLVGRIAGEKLPENEDIVLYAVEAEDVTTFSEACTPAVAAAIPKVVDQVLSELNEFSGASVS